MDLNKAFETITHKLLFAKLYAYGFGGKALLIIRGYLANRQQRVKASNTFVTKYSGMDQVKFVEDSL